MRLSLAAPALLVATPATASLGARVARRVVSVCPHCSASRLPGRAPGAPERWGPLAPSVHDEIRAGARDLVVDRRLCPACDSTVRLVT